MESRQGAHRMSPENNRKVTDQTGQTMSDCQIGQTDHTGELHTSFAQNVEIDEVSTGKPKGLNSCCTGLQFGLHV